MDRKLATPDGLVAELAAKQHGMVSIDQLRDRGIGEKGIRSRLASGRLHRVHRGVYTLGHVALSPEGRSMAAVLALGMRQQGRCPDADSEEAWCSTRGEGLDASRSVLGYWGAAVSHRSAACLWGLLPLRAGPVDVVVSGNGGRARRHGIRVHRSRSLPPADVTLRKRIPVTTPRRTIDDLRSATARGGPGGFSDRELRRAIRQADVLGLPIGEEGGRDRTRSDLERDFLRLCRRYGLPAPEVNVLVGPYLVDFLWRERRLAVETDGYLYHRGQVAFQDDHKRDLGLRRLRYDLMRFSEQQLDQEPERIAEDLAGALGVEL